MSITISNIRVTPSRTRVRPTAVAGTFYPADSGELRRVVQEMLEAAAVETAAPKAIIVPHAGYIYSGTTAAKAYAGLHKHRQQITRVILLGPAHRVHVKGLALPTTTAFATPLGRINIDTGALKQIKHLAQVQLSDPAHAQEHSLEVHLPFLQFCLDRFDLVPLVVGDASPDEVAEVLDILWGGEETLIVISSDLSHYHDYASAQRIDSATSSAIETMQFDAIVPTQACGCRPMNGLLKTARQRQMQIKRVGLCNSGDTAGSRERVVGYGAWSLYEKQGLDDAQRKLLIDIARRSIETGFSSGQALKVDPADYSSELRATRASFITLKLRNQLRGCIGTTEPVHALVTSVAENAFSAAFRDPRFKPLTRDEYEKITLSIAVLTPQTPVEFKTDAELLRQLTPGSDGLTIKKGTRKATFLPAVWETIPDRNSFLAQLKLKAGMKLDEEVDMAWRYSTESFK